MISIIIPSWNGRHLLEKSLPALVTQMRQTDQIIVIDNGSADGTVQWLKEHWPQIVCIELSENMGFCGAVNRGIEAAGSRDVILVNNDTEALPGWLNAMLQAAEQNDEFHIFAGRVLLADSPDYLDTAGDGFTVAGFGYKLGWLHPDGPEFDESKEVFSASGCSMYIRRSVFDSIGMFDESFFAFGEDLDFCFRARLAGFRVLYVPDARILHAVRATASAPSTLFWYHRNLLWILVKNLPVQLWILYCPHIFLHMGLVGVRACFRGWFEIYIRSLLVSISGLAPVLEQRRRIQSCRKVTLSSIRKYIDWNWLSIHWRLHRAKALFKNAQSTHPQPRV